MKKKILLLAALLAYPVIGQTTQGSTTADSGSTFDLSPATVTRPMRTGTTLPATCTVGDQFFKTDATAGQNLYGCTASNTWSQQAGGGGGGGAFNAISSGTNTTAAMVVGTGSSLFTAGSGTIAASTAAALAANPSPCSNQVVTDIAADGTLTCASVSNAMITNSTIDLTAKVTGILPNGNTTAASANTASAIVARDGSGNFSAGTITAGLTGNVTGNLTGTASNATALTRDGCTTVSFSATPTFTATNDNCFVITLTANVTSCTVTGAVSGQILTFYIIEDGTGGWTFACSSLNNLQTIETGASVRNTQTFVYDGSAVQALGYMFSSGSNITPGVTIPGTTSGSLKIFPAAIAGTNSLLRLPGGSTDFSATGGTSQVVKQATTGAALTVGTLSCADLSDDSTLCDATPTFATLTDGATITWAIGSELLANASVTLGGNRALNITNPVAGGSYVLKVIQDATGSRGLTLGTGCTWKVSGGGSGAITPSTGANKIDVLAFTYDGTNCLANFNTDFN